MNILDYCDISDSRLSFTRSQASRFAKQVAGDFNPIHNEGAKRFCVPGDLLFSLMLIRYGVSNSTLVEFEGMVNEDTRLDLPDEIDQEFALLDARNREFLKITHAAKPVQNTAFATALVSAYVQFSGQTFPEILVDLMRSENVMINPARPLVIYKQMSVELSTLDADELTLQFAGATLSSDGKKGEAQLNFELRSAGQLIGKGHKIMLLGGLREYNQDAIDGIISTYNDAKLAYANTQG